VSTETEIKIKIEDPACLCRQLNAWNPVVLSERHFEDNYLFDFPNRNLGSKQSLLRVRFAGSRSCLTYKGPPRLEGIFKIREELETDLPDGAMMLQILEKIGMQVCFRYQKYRREFAFEGVHVAVDETPIGNFMEIEGAEDGIRNLAQKIGYEDKQFLRASYYSLYLEYCQKMHAPPEFMVFQND
jgi:adenylate cyclase class 2